MRYAIRYGKTESIGLVWTMIWVLPNNDHFGLFKRTMVKGGEDLFARWVTGVLLILFFDKINQPLKIRLVKFVCKWLFPAIVDIDGQNGCFFMISTTKIIIPDFNPCIYRESSVYVRRLRPLHLKPHVITNLK